MLFALFPGHGEVAVNPTWLLVVLAAGGVLVAVTRWTAQVDADRERFKKFMRDVGRKIDRILSRVPSRLATSGSPVTLTELGQQVADEIEAYSWADSLLLDLRERADGKEPYQVHKLCVDFVNDELGYTVAQRHLLERVAFRPSATGSQRSSCRKYWQSCSETSC